MISMKKEETLKLLDSRNWIKVSRKSWSLFLPMNPYLNGAELCPSLEQMEIKK